LHVSDSLGWSFKQYDFPDLQRPDTPQFISVSATEEQADEQSAMEEEGDDSINQYI